MKHVVMVVVIAVIMGCSTRPNPIADFDQVESSRLYGFARHADATIVVSNEAPVAAPTCLARIFLDQRPAADLKPHETAYLHVALGAHRLQVKPSGECVGQQPDDVGLELKTGDALLLSLKPTVEGAFKLVRSN